MKSLKLYSVCFFILLLTQSRNKEASNIVIASGKMPNIAKDKSNNIHIVYGSGDSIMYTFSKNDKLFTPPELVAVLPTLFASSMRGPQIAVSDQGPVVTACTHSGNTFSYTKSTTGKWTKAKRVNDADETAKEALMGLSSDGKNTFAVWLGVKSAKGQSVYGARSSDGGNTWSKNVVVYASPDGTVCECCKPSVVVKDNTVFVMFRNWLNGGRDLYVIKSSNAGMSFGRAEKLGKETWKLNGCPMDGGGLVLNRNGQPETVWRREGKIYTSLVGSAEKEIGEGKGCSIESVDDKTIYTWSENGEIVVLTADRSKKNLGKGSLPLIKSLTNKQAICVWENDNKIYTSLVEI